jgi:hypothetical protein
MESGRLDVGLLKLEIRGRVMIGEDLKEKADALRLRQGRARKKKES